MLSPEPPRTKISQLSNTKRVSIYKKESKAAQVNLDDLVNYELSFTSDMQTPDHEHTTYGLELNRGERMRLSSLQGHEISVETINQHNSASRSSESKYIIDVVHSQVLAEAALKGEESFEDLLVPKEAEASPQTVGKAAHLPQNQANSSLELLGRKVAKGNKRFPSPMPPKRNLKT